MICVICTDISPLSNSDYKVLYENASEERKIRAARYRSREDALLCVTADALLRHALGWDDYTAEKSPSGKPFIKGRENFHFNLSHSGSWVAIAYGDTEVGIDVERHRTDAKQSAIAKRFFTPEEQQYLAEDPQCRFFEIWTAKESYLKYLGTGLNKDIKSFSVLSLPPELRLHHRLLSGGYHLTLCTTEDNYRFTLLDAKDLL